MILASIRVRVNEETVTRRYLSDGRIMECRKPLRMPAKFSHVANYNPAALYELIDQRRKLGWTILSCK